MYAYCGLLLHHDFVPTPFLYKLYLIVYGKTMVVSYSLSLAVEYEPMVHVFYEFKSLHQCYCIKHSFDGKSSCNRSKYTYTGVHGKVHWVGKLFWLIGHTLNEDMLCRFHNRYHRRYDKQFSIYQEF